MKRLAEHIAFVLGLIAASSDTGFKFVQFLVRVQKWIEKRFE